jgi:hypothetical protein
MMLKGLAVVNAIVTVVLLVILLRVLKRESRPQTASDTIRTKLVEIENPQGKVAATLGYTDGSHQPAFSLYDSGGRQAVTISLNSRGEATMYFSDPKTEGIVSVGYLWGSDVVSSPDEEDPLGSWGIRIRKGSQFKSLDSFDPHHLLGGQQAIKPVRVIPEPFAK